MTDRELLELAAKVAGVEGEVTKWGVWLKGGGVWRPHTDDGDALRLAVKLELPIEFWGGMVIVGVVDEVGEECGNDPLAATRRAIVRAAAEIGRAMK